MSIKKSLTITFLFAAITAIATIAYKEYKDPNKLEITLDRTTNFVSPNTLLQLDITNYKTPIETITVTTQQNEKTTTVENKKATNDEKNDTQRLSISLKKAKLQDGPFKLTVTVEKASLFNFWQTKPITKSWDLTLDSKPPHICIHSPTAYIHRGSSTAFAYSVSKPIATTGVEINQSYFPAFQQSDNTYYCFFPFPIEYSTATYTPYIIAEDFAGNKTRVPLPIHPIQRTFKSDTLIISDNFLEKKMPSFEQIIPDATTQIDRYIKVNSKVRVSNEQKLIEISKKTAPTMLWSKNFYSLPKSIAKATFGEERSYTYHNQKIDQQIHMGLDLASVAHAPVPAANDGVVVFVNDLGIFGNLVVIDHGLGLQTLYAHLSNFNVQENQSVKKGDIIGYTGTSGLAGGDHLHFGITVGGIQVNPIDWLDPKWIKNTITDRLSIPENKS